MKAKLLLMLFLVSLGLGVYASESSKKRPRAYCKVEHKTAIKRSLFDPFVQTEDINDCLYLTFRFSLHDTDITVLDKDGNEVVKEQQAVIYEGRVIAIPQSDGYPYSIEITSPIVEIQGEVTLEE